VSEPVTLGIERRPGRGDFKGSAEGSIFAKTVVDWGKDEGALKV